MLKLRERTNSWPGFVDLFSNLVIILIFLLIVFVFLWTTTSIFGAGGGAKKIAVLAQANAEQAQKLEQMTQDEQEARQLLVLARSALEDLEGSKANMEKDLKTLEQRNSELDQRLSTTSETLSGRIADYERKLAEMQSQGASMTAMVQSLESQLQTARQTEEIATGELELQKQALLSELARMNDLLAEAEHRSAEQEIQYVELSSRLNKALADKVAELNELAAQKSAMSQYQSQFYKEIRTALAGLRGVDVSSDRFVVSSDILFQSGSYSLSIEGKNQLRLIANVMLELEEKIPTDVSWIIRVDGHTDKKPVIPGTRGFRNNTELSLLRARAVADELSSYGVSPRRLVPSGFGELHPAELGTDKDSLQKNRRIELRLTNP